MYGASEGSSVHVHTASSGFTDLPGERSTAAGDAVKSYDPLCGEGVVSALESGIWNRSKFTQSQQPTCGSSITDGPGYHTYGRPARHVQHGRTLGLSPFFEAAVTTVACIFIGLIRKADNMTRYQRVIQILDEAIGGPDVSIGVHGTFWRSMTRDQFVAKKVFGRELLKLNTGAESNLVKALKGESPFGADLPDPPLDSEFSRMPAGLDRVPVDRIAFIEQWIDEGCLEDEFVPAVAGPGVAELKWRPTNAPVASSRTDDIWFLNPSEGWAVNSNGQIVHTTDGGETWLPQLMDPEVYFRCIGFATPRHGWAGTLTPGKTLFQTTNGGLDWTLVSGLPTLAPPAICGISVVSEKVVYASGTNFPNRPARVMKTLDGGVTWTGIEMRPHAHILVDCFFLDQNRGWVVGGKTDQPVPRRDNMKPVVLFTEDGGSTWVNRVAAIQDQFPLGEWGWKIQFLDDMVGFVSLENFNAGAILRTIDGGLTWMRLEINDPQRNANLEGVGFVDENHGWVGGWGDAQFQRRSTSETLDGGLTWRDANEIGKAINRFRFFGKPVTTGYASGLTVYKYSAEPVTEFAASLAASKPAGQLLDNLEPLEAAGYPQIDVNVPSASEHLAVRIWDRFGDPIRLLVDEPKPVAGRRTLSWDRTDQQGQPVPTGHYILRITADGISESRLIQLRSAEN